MSKRPAGARRRFSDSYLARLKIPDGQREVILFESGTGLGIRASRNQIAFVIQTRLKDGRRWRETLGPWGKLTIAAARSIAQQRSADAARGGKEGDLFAKHADEIAAARMSAAARKLTVRALAERWRREWLSQRRPAYAARAHERVLRHFAALLDRPAAALTRLEVREALETTRSDNGPAAARNAAASLRGMLRWALSEDLLAADPLAGLKLPPRNEDRSRVLSISEARRIYGVASSLPYPAGHFVRLLLLSGCRRSEIAALKWDEIKVDNDGLQAIELGGPRTKTGAGHHVPLSDEALAVLADCQRQRIVGSPYVLTGDGWRAFNNFSRTKQALDEALADDGGEIEDWRLHDFRRCIVSTLAGKPFRYDPTVLDRLLGHAPTKLSAVARIYQREEHHDLRREALQAWSLCLTLRPEPVVALPLPARKAAKR